MEKLKEYILSWLGITWELDLLHRQDESIIRDLYKFVKQHEARVGIDLRWKSSSTAVVLARTPEGDRVELIELKERLTLQELDELKEILESKYGARLHWVDSPRESHPFRY